MIDINLTNIVKVEARLTQLTRSSGEKFWIKKLFITNTDGEEITINLFADEDFYLAEHATNRSY
jgi:hypothetical protein